MSISKIVITGASGFVAKNIRQYFSQNNVKLVSISRNNFTKFKNETKILSKDYEKIDLNEIKQSSTLIHLAGIGRQTAENDYNSINVELTKKIIKLCKKAKIKKIIYLSGLGVSKNTTLGYFISKYKAEQEIISSNLDYIIFRPSYIVGKNDLLSKYLLNQIKHGKIKIPGSGKYHIQPISINDVSKILYQTIHHKKFNNKILDLVGSELITFEKYVKLFSKNSKTKIYKIKLEDAYYQAINNPKSQFSVDDLNLLVGDFKGDHKKLRKLSRINFQSVKEILKTSSLS